MFLHVIKEIKININHGKKVMEKHAKETLTFGCPSISAIENAYGSIVVICVIMQDLCLYQMLEPHKKIYMQLQVSGASSNKVKVSIMLVAEVRILPYILVSLHYEALFLIGIIRDQSY